MDTKHAKVEESKKDENVRRALGQTGGRSIEKKKNEIPSTHKFGSGL